MALNYVQQFAFFLFSLHSLCSAETESTKVTIHGSCSFAKPTFPLQNEMTVSMTMPAGSAAWKLSCNIWYNSSKHVLHLWLHKTSHGNHTFLVNTVLDQDGALALPGYVMEAQNHVSYPFHVCPKAGKVSTYNYSLFLSAPPKTRLNLTVQVDESILQEGQMESIQIGLNMSSRLLVFNIASVHSIYDHFHVTVRSDNRDMECLLIVSNECLTVANVDPQAINFKESGSALRLTFTTFGRITLSHASKPQLKTGRWFIGVFLGHRYGQTAVKKVEVSVHFAKGTRRTQVTSLALLSIFGGLAIALFAHVFLNPDFQSEMLVRFHRYISERVYRISTAHNDNVRASETNENKSDLETIDKDGLAKGVSITLSPISQDDVNVSATAEYDTAGCRVPKQWPGFKNWAVVFFDWFNEEQKNFAYTTAIVAFSLLTGAAQFIISNWSSMIETGNRDTCYYNEGCYRAMTTVDIPFNLIISNLTYVIHGVLLALSISLREATSRFNEVVPRKSYCIPYAFAWALFFEGIFSSFYHLCPSRLTFQFDSAFMFVIAGLVLVALFNSQVEKARGSDASRDRCGDCGYPISDSKLFLFYLIPLLLLNYLGTIRDTEGFLLFPNWVFYCLAILWILAMFAWAFYRLMLPWKPSPEPRFRCKFVWLCIVLPLVLLFIGVYTIDVKKDWSQFFLFTCVTCVVCTLLGLSLEKCSQNIYERAKRRRELSTDERRELRWCSYMTWPIVNFPIVIYMIAMTVCWILAIYYFLHKSVTQKIKLPSRSRESNKECVLWDYFDYHDLWHILSSFALLQTAYVLLWSIG